MATFTFDGTSSVTASKTDTVFISADPTTFTQATDNGSSVTLAFGSQTLTITGTTLVNGGLPGVFVTGGQFAYAGSTNSDTPVTTGNVLSFLVPTGGSYTVPTTGNTASSKVAIFGGLGRTDSIDGADSIVLGGKGTTLVYSNSGNDTITQTTAFDSTSTVNVYADGGADSVILTASNTKASIFVSGGTDVDSINVVNSGTTTIFGGLDSADAGDRITFNGVSGAAGTSQIFGNGGNDSINVGAMGDRIDSTSTTTIYGGFGDDSITAFGLKATVSVLGGEGADTISVTNNGSTYITGGNQSGDQSLDGADNITFVGSGNALIYGNVGADTIDVTLRGGNDSTTTTDLSVYGGKDNDLITIQANGTGKAAIFAVGGENSDNITVAGNGGAVTIYGGVSASDSADGADTIAYSSAGNGVANIFANGGADSVSIGTLGTADSTNATVTVYGGGGADSISVAGQASTSQALVLNGNEGSDTFTITKGTGQTITVSDFTATSAGDKLALTGLTGANPGNLQVTTGNFQTLQQALDAASNASGGTAAQNKAAAVVFGGSTYVVIESGTAGFQAATDQAIKLTGVTDLVGLVGQTTLSGSAVQPPKIFFL